MTGSLDGLLFLYKLAELGVSAAWHTALSALLLVCRVGQLSMGACSLKAVLSMLQYRSL